MPKEVIKKDGTKEPFDAEKIKTAIKAAGAFTDVSEDRLGEVTDQVTAAVVQALSDKDDMTTSEVREKVLAELDSAEKTIADSWRQYDEEKKNS
ncbi:MAG: ATP cone domain-containing protein [Candidatus Portnoybacteria bacterium]